MLTKFRQQIDSRIIIKRLPKLTFRDKWWKIKFGRCPLTELAPISIEMKPDTGYVNITALWRSVGSPEPQRPRRVLGGRQVKEFISALQEGEEEPVAYTVGHNRASATWAHPVLALEYARHINPRLAVAINTNFLLTHPKARVAIEIAADSVEKKVSPLVERVQNRLNVGSLNDTLVSLIRDLEGDSSDVVMAHGRKYIGLYRMTAEALAGYRGIRSGKKTIPDRMDGPELAAHTIISAAAMSSSRNADCAADVADFMERHTGEMRRLLTGSGIEPRDWPVAEPIQSVPKLIENLNERLRALRPDEETGVSTLRK